MPLKKGFMIDVQGTLIDDHEKKPLAGSVEAIRSLHAAKTPYVLVTNNTKVQSAVFKNYLRELGFLFSDDQYLDPLMVLDKIEPPSQVAAYGSEPFLDLLRRRGYHLSTSSPSAVLVAIREDFSNDDYASMIEHVLQGARLIGMHETSIYAKHGRRYPGVGAILQMVAFATGKGYTVVGKPSEAFYQEALDRLRRQEAGVAFADVTMISDDLIGDLIGAKRMGMQTVLVLSGKIGSLEEVQAVVTKGADVVAQDIADFFARGNG